MLARWIAAAAALVLGSLSATAGDAGATAFVNGITRTMSPASGGMTAMGVPLDNEGVTRKVRRGAGADDPRRSEGVTRRSRRAGRRSFVNAQDWDIKSFDVKVVDNGADKATATVHFKNIDTQETFVLSLVKVGGQWRIHDINWGANGTLRGLFQH